MADDWKRFRTHNQRFNAEELAYIKDSYREGQTVLQIARHLRCASRSISAHFKKLQAAGVIHGTAVKVTSKANYTARLYKPLWDI